MSKTKADLDTAVENPGPASSALILSNPEVPGSNGKGLKGITKMALPLLQQGAAVGGGYIGANLLRGTVSLPLSRAVFGEDKVTPGKALTVDWLIQMAAAITAYKMLPKKWGGLVAGGIIASQVVTTVKFFMPAKPNVAPNALQRSLDTMTFIPANGGGVPQQGIMAPRRALNGIMPMRTAG